MSADPLSAAANALQESHRLLNTATQESRQAWDDDARRRIDSQYCDKITAESRTAVAILNRAARDITQALRILGR